MDASLTQSNSPPDPARDLIARLLAAQALGISLEQYDAAVGGGASPYQYPTDPADPADYSGLSTVGFTSTTPGHLSDTATNPEGTLGSVLGNPNSGMPSPGYVSPSFSDLTAQAQPGDFGPAPSPGRTAADVNSAFNAFEAAAKGDRGEVSQTGRFSDVAPSSVLGPSISQSAINEGHNTNVANALADVLAGYPATTPDPVTSDILGPSIDVAAVNEGHNANVASALADVLSGYTVDTGTTGTPGGFGTGTGFSSANAANDAVGAALASAIDAASGGYTGGGPTGAGEGGGTGAGISGGGFSGDGVGGASTGISGGPGGTGEGGANTGEGGGGGGGGGGGAGK